MGGIDLRNEYGRRRLVSMKWGVKYSTQTFTQSLLVGLCCANKAHKNSRNAVVRKYYLHLETTKDRGCERNVGMMEIRDTLRDRKPKPTAGAR
jgi:hypothetical protein